ncbi:methylated-DNA--[protein]-cysteine S-methyltransferase [Calycomorphotria hydatis]|uniref:methylated-DNA--[protein]-cysteine S-methyltransferase n=1 Tax=Calycomorphotria hydatis TaxID=2528027 RepID=A0A517T868_9PLAN|nr:MGMT family protein [Calycomorphotria hydatis]QDT64575.1 Methylated-DNA--protein-cysteine methyltransferase [Calycomorphotria hydatis]
MDFAREWRVITEETKMGWFSVLFDNGEVRGTAIGHADATAAEKGARRAARDNQHTTVQGSMEEIVNDFRGYFHGELVDFGRYQFNVSQASEFHRHVTAALVQIGYGERLSYRDLAMEAGSPGAARAVGNIMRKNPLPLIVPCHRVVGSSGHLGGFSAPGGTTFKQQLLDLERQHVQAQMKLCGTANDDKSTWDSQGTLNFSPA